MKKIYKYIFFVFLAVLLIIVSIIKFTNSSKESINRESGFQGEELSSSDINVESEKETIADNNKQKLEPSIKNSEDADKVDAIDVTLGKGKEAEDSISGESEDNRIIKGNSYENLVEPPKVGSDIEF